MIENIRHIKTPANSPAHYAESQLIMCFKPLIGVLFLLLIGCSSIAVHDPNISSNKKAFELSYCVVSSSEMATITETISDEENKKTYEEGIKIAINDISQKLQSSMEHTLKLHIVALPECLDDTAELNISSDLYLRVELSGYGSLKEEWKNLLIGSGIVEGIVQGVVVGAATSNPWLGLAVGAEEIGSEYLTWNGVDWILGETFAPVTLEGRLQYSKNKEIIWQDSAFVTENEDALNDDEKKDKLMQLKASLHKAEKELIASLNEYLADEILKSTK